ncbi:MAG: SDR family oxidoreductase [Leptospira sp.]|nr:SDR family oxidoreductase [Leptospira sp.]
MKQVFVAGSGSGIGESLLRKLDSREDVFVNGISRRGEFFSGDNKIEKGKNYRCDLKSEKEIDLFVDFYLGKIKILDALYLCAGDGLFKPISGISGSDWDDHFLLNVKSNFLLLKAFYPVLKNSEAPFVCFISSTAAKKGFPDSSAYCASKHAVTGLAKALREEWKPDRIRVFTIFLGAVSTDIWNDRPEFDRKDMIEVGALSQYLESFLFLDKSINIEESYLLPLKGVL